MSSDVDLSIIIPVYNTMPDLRRCLESVVSQDMGEHSYEIVAVDDGSTDGGGELLDEYANRHPAMHVVHQENSGWPGRPRNVGIGSSRGRYLFFMDADDELAPESLRRQVTFADKYGSDLVIPMLQSEPGVKPPGALWRKTAVDADRALVFKTLSPQKLFRRTFVEKHDLRFPEGVVPLEDGLVLAQAYLLADRVSVLADHDYYYKRRRTAGGNISIARKPPIPFTKSVTEIIDIAKRLAGDPAIEDRIVVDIYRRKALKYLRPNRFLHYDGKMQQEWVDAISELANTRIRADLDRKLPLDARIQSAAVRTGDVAVVRNSARALKSNSVPAHVRKRRILARLPEPAGETTVDATRDVEITAHLASLRRTADALKLETQIHTRWLDLHGAGLNLVLRDRSGVAPDAVVPLRAQHGSGKADGRSRQTCSALLSTTTLAGEPPSRWDAYVRVGGHRSAIAEARLRRMADSSSGLHLAPARLGQKTIYPYITTHDNVSFRTMNEHENKGIGRRALAISQPIMRRARSLARASMRFSADARARLRRFAGRVLGRLGMSRRGEPPGGGSGTVLSAEPNDQDLFDRHTALYKRLVSEHVSHIVSSYDVNCVLDVGANKGQFARELRRSGYSGHIVSFEPVPHIFDHLERAAAGDPKWTVYPYALGREDGSIEMKVVYGTMSSALGPTEYGRRRYKRFRNISTVDVPLRRLDGLLDEIIPNDVGEPRWYLKLDTQGFDVEVFAGLGDRAAEIVAMQSEMALLSIYEGMPRLPAALETYEAAGFEVSGMFPVTRERDTGRVLEFDCVLVRADSLEAEDA